jgi:methanogenic corrinoid protein MtbC1
MEYRIMGSCFEKFKNALSRILRISARKPYQNRQPDVSPLTFAEIIIIPALKKIGSGWPAGKVWLSQVYMAGRICEDLFSAIRALSSGHPRHVHSSMKVTLAVLSDKYFAGKRIVASGARLAGINLADYGLMEAAPPVEQVTAEGFDILCFLNVFDPGKGECTPCQ